MRIDEGRNVGSDCIALWDTILTNPLKNTVPKKTLIRSERS